MNILQNQNESQIARSIFGKPLQSVQAAKRPDTLKNHGGFVSEFNHAAIEKKIQIDVNGKMDIEIMNENGTTPQPKKGDITQSNLDNYVEFTYDM